MKAIQVKCPQCGAALKVETGAEWVVCDYCSTRAVVQHRAGVLERRQPVPARVPGTPGVPVAVQKKSGAGALLVPVLVVIIVGVVVMVARREGRTEEDRLNALTWHGTTRALLHDVNGDGVPDLVGRARRLARQPTVHVLVALDGSTGRKLWETPPLKGDIDSNGYLARAAVAGELVLFTDPQGGAHAYALADGTLRWEAVLGEVAESFCVVDGGPVVIRTADDVDHPFSPADGTPATVSGDCTPVSTDHEDGEVGLERESGSGDPRFQVEGMTAFVVLRRPGGPWVALGPRDRGTSVPMIAVLDEGVVRWKSELPGTDPLSATGGIPEADQVGLAEDRVYALFDMSGSPTTTRLTGFDLRDGRRLWETTLVDNSPTTGVSVGPTLVYVSAWGHLEAFDRDTGKLVFDATPIR